jgi:hypothetical protein
MTIRRVALVLCCLALPLAIYLLVGPQVRGFAGPLDLRGSPLIKAIVPGRLEIAPAAASPSSARPAPSDQPPTKFRFGFLEFEDDPDAPAK